MARRRILWQLYPSYLIITVISVVAIFWFASRSFRTLYVKHTIRDLESRAVILQPLVAEHLPPTDTAYLAPLVRNLAAATGTQITIADPNGRVVADSRRSGVEEDLRGLVEFTDAVAGNTGTAIRLNLADGARHIYVTAPIRRGGVIVGVVRMSYPFAAIDDSLRELRNIVGLAVVVISLLAALLSWYVARRISRPLEEMKKGAERYAAGDLEPPLSVPDSSELGALADAINRMAAQLHERIQTAVKQRNEQEAILSSMAEGIFVVDTNDRLVTINEAAARLFELDPADARGRMLQQAVRHPALQRIVEQVLKTRQSVTDEVILYESTERFLQVEGSVLRGERSDVVGALIVLHDMTRIRQLENIRREFVANVSHELRTPVTAIKGYVETLLDGPHSPEDERRFLDVIMRQADRLNAIIEDLLSLSRIEQGVEPEALQLDQRNLAEVLNDSLLGVDKTAEAKQVTLRIECDSALSARVNAPLLEQAILNLVDNAIKYSNSGGTVTVSARQTETETAISVTDTGCGIAAEHIPRLFERFFRVDKSRSREAGGTGLGLAIVKHIVLAHGGSVSVVSEIDKGSTFTIHLPRPKVGRPATA